MSILNNIKKFHKRGVILFVFILAIFVILSTISFSKYFYDDKSISYVANVQDFYFDSNVLGATSENKKYTISNYQDGEKISFSVRNYDDSLRKTNEDIHYDITTSIVSASGSKTEVSDVVITRNSTIVDGSYVLNSTNNETYFDIMIPSNYFVDRMATIEVQAISSAPFESNLSATFTFYQPFNDAFLKVEDEVGNESLILTVSTYELAGSLTIDYPNTIYPDRLNSIIGEGLDGNKEIINGSGTSLSSFVVNVSTFSTYEIVFFKQDSSIAYTVDDFIKR